MPGIWEVVVTGGAGGGASTADPFIVNGTAADLSAAQQLSNVLGSGTLASRPAAAAGNANWYYFATDTNQWYQSNGATWTARTPLGTDTTKLAIANNLSDVASQQTSLNNLAGAVTNNQVLAGNGTNVTMRALAAADIPSLDASKTTTGQFTTARMPSKSRVLFNFGGSNAGSIASTASLLGGAQTNLIPASTVGDILRLRVAGKFSNTSGSTSTMFVQAVFGSSTSVLTLSSLTMVSGSGDRQWFADALYYIGTVAAGSGTMTSTISSVESAQGAQLYVVANTILSGNGAVISLTNNAAMNFDVQVSSTVNNVACTASLSACVLEYIVDT